MDVHNCHLNIHLLRVEKFTIQKSLNKYINYTFELYCKANLKKLVLSWFQAQFNLFLSTWVYF